MLSLRWLSILESSISTSLSVGGGLSCAVCDCSVVVVDS